MSNMSYCRFTNTALNLEDCSEHMDDEDLSDSEEKAKKRLIKLCQDIADDWGEEDD